MSTISCFLLRSNPSLSYFRALFPLTRAIMAASSTSTSAPIEIDGQEQERPSDIEILRQETERRNRLQKISDAMKQYLIGLQNYEENLEDQKLEFEQGKRHLANIMGFDPSTMTQNQINLSIQYLFPSGLHDSKATPKMIPPDSVIPPQKIDVDQNGWPKHTLFYTLRPKFYTLLSDINRRTQRLVEEYDHQMLAYDKGESTEPPRGHPVKVGLTGWKYDGERLNEDMHASIVMALEYMAQQPNASLEAEFLESFGALKSHTDDKLEESKPTELFLFSMKSFLETKVTIRPDGRREALAVSRLKATRMQARVITPGTGIITVDGHGYDEFRSIQSREILLSPMIVTGLLGEVDVIAEKLEGPGGHSVIPRSVRHAAAIGLAVLFPNYAERLRLAGLLNPDVRTRERSKISQPGARAKYIWKKR